MPCVILRKLDALGPGSMTADVECIEDSTYACAIVQLTVALAPCLAQLMWQIDVLQSGQHSMGTVHREECRVSFFVT